MLHTYLNPSVLRGAIPHLISRHSKLRSPGQSHAHVSPVRILRNGLGHCWSHLETTPTIYQSETSVINTVDIFMLPLRSRTLVEDSAAHSDTMYGSLRKAAQLGLVIWYHQKTYRQPVQNNNFLINLL